MLSIRRQLAAIAFAVLTVQAGAAAVFPLARQIDAQAATAGDDDPCCQGMAPGQTCPMHRKSTSSSTPASNAEARFCADCCPDQALTTAFDSVAVLPAIDAPGPKLPVGDAVAVPQPSPISLAAPPDARPPRS